MGFVKLHNIKGLWTAIYYKEQGSNEKWWKFWQAFDRPLTVLTAPWSCRQRLRLFGVGILAALEWAVSFYLAESQLPQSGLRVVRSKPKLVAELGKNLFYYVFQLGVNSIAARAVWHREVIHAVIQYHPNPDKPEIRSTKFETRNKSKIEMFKCLKHGNFS